jgi:hypothetical protein
VWASEPADALLEAERALEAASRARPADRKVFVQRAQRALASLPQEAREPLEALLDEAATDGDLSDIARARRSIRAYRESLAPSPTPSPTPDRVKQQLDAIFAEPDMQIPPKSLMERLSEAFLNAVETVVRWLSRLFGGLGGFGGGGLGQFLQWFVIVLLVLTLALAVSYIAGRVQFRRRARTTLAALDALPDDARTLSAREWRELARRLAYEGNWQQASRAYYLGTLRLLHEAKLLDYDPRAHQLGASAAVAPTAARCPAPLPYSSARPCPARGGVPTVATHHAAVRFHLVRRDDPRRGDLPPVRGGVRRALQEGGGACSSCVSGWGWCC